jgi:hypothetical protein
VVESLHLFSEAPFSTWVGGTTAIGTGSKGSFGAHVNDGVVLVLCTGFAPGVDTKVLAAGWVSMSFNFASGMPYGYPSLLAKPLLLLPKAGLTGHPPFLCFVLPQMKHPLFGLHSSHHSKMQKDGWAKYIANFAFI